MAVSFLTRLPGATEQIEFHKHHVKPTKPSHPSAAERAELNECLNQGAERVPTHKD